MQAAPEQSTGTRELSRARPCPKGLREGDRINPPLFTPTTKAETGHDQPLSWQELEKMVGPSLVRQFEERSLEIYSFAQDSAWSRARSLPTPRWN